MTSAECNIKPQTGNNQYATTDCKLGGNWNFCPIVLLMTVLLEFSIGAVRMLFNFKLRRDYIIREELQIMESTAV